MKWTVPALVAPPKGQEKWQPIARRIWHSAMPQPGSSQTRTKTTAQLSLITPRWLVHLLQWVPVEAGIYRLNKVVNVDSIDVACPPRDESELPQTFVPYDESPREYFLNSVATVLDVHTRVSDLYSSPYDQIKEQLRLTIETIKERQEGELINNADYGMLANVTPEQTITTLTGPPTPDDLDQLLTKVWKEPAFFLAHPLAIAAFGRECTSRGVPPPTVSLFGSQFITWRGVPLIPSDKIGVEGEQDQDPAAADRRKAPGGRRALPARAHRRAGPGTRRPLHGDQQERHCVLPHLPLLLAGRPHRRRVGRARRRGGRSLPRLRAKVSQVGRRDR